jgi:FlaA1/EpsC-like NDP-sugar epimerase
MITSSDSSYTYDLGKYYVILPSTSEWDLNEFINHNKALKVKENFNYSSGTNKEWETVESLKLLIKKHVIDNED